jgi:hypothetical protein
MLRWTARVSAFASVALVLLFMIGEGFDPTRLTAREWLGFLFFPLGISIGMVLGWRHEGAGGALTVGCLAAFYAIHRAMTGSFPRGWAWLVFTTPGFLFLLSAWLSRGAPRPRLAP